MDPTTLKAIDDFRKAVKRLLDVTKVSYDIAGDRVDFKTLSNTRKGETLYKIYQLEMALMDACPLLKFDFTVIFS